MPPKALAPPPRPDPVTLDQIYTALTTPDCSLNERAYHLVALSTVAFHPSVKLFLYEGVPEDRSSPTEERDSTAEASHPRRREAVVRGIASLLAQRNNAVCEECRWETVSLLGELCRMDNTAANGRQTAAPQAQLEAKLNEYAMRNLEYLASLPWFTLAAHALLDAASSAAAGKEKEKEKDGSSPPAATGMGQATPSPSSSNGKARSAEDATAAVDAAADAKARGGKETPSREELRRRIQERQSRHGMGADHGAPQEHAGPEPDEDVVVALRDILRALPTAAEEEEEQEDPNASAAKTKTKKKWVWTAEALAQARDLMFLDASTDLLHLIPTVSRCHSDVCSMCSKKCGGVGGGRPFLRCSSCKAVYYCSAECQRQHWALSHRQPCRAFKERCEYLLAEYHRLNSSKGGKAGPRKKASKSGAEGDRDTVAVLEVALEPSLFYETRRYLYDHRDPSFGEVSFFDYYMKYAVRGN